MTQHLLSEHEQEDIETMRNLRRFVGAFMAFALIMAVGVTIFAP